MKLRSGGNIQLWSTALVLPNPSHAKHGDAQLVSPIVSIVLIILPHFHGILIILPRFHGILFDSSQAGGAGGAHIQDVSSFTIVAAHA